jgi:hypothetical protein
MAARTVKHLDHEHSMKMIKTNINGLVIDDQSKPTDSIMEALGGTNEQFDKITDKMVKYFNFVHSQEELYDDGDLPQSTKLSLLADFLNSPSFKMIGFPLKDPNHFFILGYIWGAVIVRNSVERDSISMNGDDLPDELKKILLKAIKKKMGEDK